MKKALFAALVLVVIFAPVVTFAAVPPLVPQPTGCNSQDTNCNPAKYSGQGYTLCDLRVEANNIIDYAVGLSVIAATLMFAYGGILYVTASSSESNIKKAHGVMTKTIIGILIVLLAWLLVNLVLSVITGGGVDFWVNNIKCDPGQWSPAFPASSPATVGFVGGGAALSPSQNAIGNCSVDGLVGSGMPANIAPTMSCMTRTEDGPCILGQPSGTDIGSDGRSVSFGMFQLNVSANNLSQYPACESAVNGAPLNCTSAFAGGAYTASNHNTHVTNLPLYNTCVSAASNPQCNVAAAQDLYLNHGGSKNWGTAAQQACGP